MRSKSLLFILSLVTSVAWGQRTPEDLTLEPLRPTVREVVDAYQERFRKPTRFTVVLQSEAHRKLARTIVLSEKIFPNLTYAVLGRDAALFGDLVEAFYLSRGQPNRVSRLNGSGDTIRPTSLFDLFVFLRQNGLRPKGDGLERPFVIFDRTEFKESSQARRLIRAAVKGLLWAGAKPENLEKQLGAVRSAHEARLLEIQMFEEGSPGPRFASSMPFADFTDTSFWHESFGVLNTDESAQRVAYPTFHFPRAEKRKVLNDLVTPLRAVQSPEFLELVRQEAEREGVTLEWLNSSGRRPITSYYDLPLTSSQSFSDKVRMLEFFSWAKFRDYERWDLLQQVQFSDLQVFRNIRTFREASRESGANDFVFAAAQIHTAIELLVEGTSRGQGTSEEKEILRKIIFEKMDDVLMRGVLKQNPGLESILKPALELTFDLRTETHKKVAAEVFRELIHSTESGTRWGRTKNYFKRWKHSALDKFASVNPVSGLTPRTMLLSVGTWSGLMGLYVAGSGLPHGANLEIAGGYGLMAGIMTGVPAAGVFSEVAKRLSRWARKKRVSDNEDSKIFDAMMIDLTDPQFENRYLRSGGAKESSSKSCGMSLKKYGS